MLKRDKYRIVDGRDSLSGETFNLIFFDLDLRLHTLEELQVSWQNAITEVQNHGLKRINATIGPVLAKANSDLAAVQHELSELQALREELETWWGVIDPVITDLQTRVDALETNLSTVQADLRAAQANITGLQKKMATIPDPQTGDAGKGLIVAHGAAGFGLSRSPVVDQAELDLTLRRQFKKWPGAPLNMLGGYDVITSLPGLESFPTSGWRNLFNVPAGYTYYSAVLHMFNTHGRNPIQVYFRCDALPWYSAKIPPRTYKRVSLPIPGYQLSAGSGMGLHCSLPDSLALTVEGYREQTTSPVFYRKLSPHDGVLKITPSPILSGEVGKKKYVKWIIINLIKSADTVRINYSKGGHSQVLLEESWPPFSPKLIVCNPPKVLSSTSDHIGGYCGVNSNVGVKIFGGEE